MPIANEPNDGGGGGGAVNKKQLFEVRIVKKLNEPGIPPPGVCGV
jgi:hypothetical protein